MIVLWKKETAQSKADETRCCPHLIHRKSNSKTHEQCKPPVAVHRHSHVRYCLLSRKLKRQCHHHCLVMRSVSSVVNLPRRECIELCMGHCAEMRQCAQVIIIGFVLRGITQVRCRVYKRPQFRAELDHDHQPKAVLNPLMDIRQLADFNGYSIPKPSTIFCAHITQSRYVYADPELHWCRCSSRHCRKCGTSRSTQCGERCHSDSNPIIITGYSHRHRDSIYQHS